MSDQPPASPPPPPSSSPLPPPPAGPTQAPQPARAAGAAGLLSQFTGNALYGILIGLATIIVPIAFNRVFFVLPIAGLIVAVYAIFRRQVIGGVIGVVLNVIGGILTIIGLTSG